MKIKKGKVSNINNRILAGIASFIILTAPLVGCSKKKTPFDWICRSYSEGYEPYGTVGFEELKEYKVVNVKSFDCENIFIMLCGEDGYYDIFSGGKILSSNGNENETMELIEESFLIDYLVAYDEIKSTYTVDDVEKILEKIKEDYEVESNKALVKE